VEASNTPELELMFRPMFGGIGVYAHGRMFCSLSDVGLALKLTGADRDELLKLRGAKALQYEPSMPPSNTYVVVPGTMLKDLKLLSRWLVRSAAAVQLAPARKPRKKRHKSNIG
jgi:TfoX/Sxy family transcriptional regulator of competence genes